MSRQAPSISDNEKLKEFKMNSPSLRSDFVKTIIASKIPNAKKSLFITQFLDILQLRKERKILQQRDQNDVETWAPSPIEGEQQKSLGVQPLSLGEQQKSMGEQPLSRGEQPRSPHRSREDRSRSREDQPRSQEDQPRSPHQSRSPHQPRSRSREDHSRKHQCVHWKIGSQLILAGWIRHFPNYLEHSPEKYCLKFFCGDCRRECFYIITRLEEVSRYRPLMFSRKEISRTTAINLCMLNCTKFGIKLITINYCSKLLKFGRMHLRANFDQELESKDSKLRLERVAYDRERSLKFGVPLNGVDQNSNSNSNGVDQNSNSNSNGVDQNSNSSDSRIIEDYFDLNDEDLTCFY